jgi:type I restriction enzyme, S subunit
MVKAGYKQTEVGVIPEDWECSNVRGIASNARNALVGGPFGSDLVSTDYVETGVPVIRGQNMSRQWVSGNFAFVTTAKARSLESNLARPGDIVFTQRGTLGQVSLVPTGPYDSYLVSQSQMKLSVNQRVADPLFFFYVFTSERQQELIRGGTIQTGVPHINLGILRDISVQLPPLPEQRAIAGALGDVDALLGALDRLIAKKRDLKQAAMQQLLTAQTRLPGFTGKWETSSVGNEFEIKLGKMLDAEKNVGVPKPFIGNRAVQWGRIDISDIATVPMSRTDIERFRLKTGDLLVCEGGEVGRAAIWDAPTDDCYYQKALHRLRPLRGFDPRLMAALLRLWSDRGQFSNYITQTSIAHLPREKFLEMPLLVPSPLEQIAIANVLSDMDAELTALEQRRDKTHLLKQGMMQELLTGRTRLV